MEAKEPMVMADSQSPAATTAENQNSAAADKDIKAAAAPPPEAKEPKEPKEPRDLNPARRPQRLYLRRERAAMPKAMNLLQSTPWAWMNDPDKKLIVDAVRSELNHVLNRDMDNYPRGAQIDYEKLVHDAVCKVFSEHLSMFAFTGEGEDESLVSELFELGPQS